MAYSIPSGYYDRVAQLESGGNPFAVATTSSASGLYQFTKATFEGLGFDWSKRFDTVTQNSAMEKFTQQNAEILSRNGFDINSPNLYALAFLGQSGGVKALSAPDSAPLSSVISGAALAANASLRGMSVGDFKKMLSAKFGVNLPGSGAGNGTGSNNGTLQGGIMGSLGDLGDGIISTVAAPGSILEFLTSFFSFKTAGRFTAVFVGILLVGLAVAALVLTSDVKPSDIVKKVVT